MKWIPYKKRGCLPKETGEYIVKFYMDEYCALEVVCFMKYDSNEGGFMSEHNDIYHLEWLDESNEYKKGKYVSRAVYAKLQAENHRLLKDIELMCRGGSEGGVTWQKWRKHFKIKYEFDNMLRDYFEKNPVKDLGEPKLDTAKGAFK